jgi:hypothetical protein
LNAQEHSDSEGSWLLVTTSRSLLLLNPNDGFGYRIVEGTGTYYGIAALGGRTYVGARGRLASSPTPVSESRGQILEFDQNLRLVRSLRPPFPLREVHQIMGFEGKLWVTCTYDNMVAIYDGAAWDKWHPRGVSSGECRDVSHFNSLSVVNGKLCLVANNNGPSEILVYDIPGRDPRETISLGTQAHNVWREGDRWMTCSSGEGKIVGSDGFSLETGGFPRGIAWVEGLAYVGVSERAERPDRDFAGGFISIYDRNWRRKGAIRLPREGVITDLLPLRVNRRALASLSPTVSFPVEASSPPAPRGCPGDDVRWQHLDYERRTGSGK